MFDFKNFFKKLDQISEANIGESPETAVLIDNDDLDFLYQLDYQHWKNALHTRYEVLLDSLRSRDNVRKSVEAQFIKSFNNLYPTAPDRQDIDLESFIDFVNNFASNFNDFGQKKETPINEKVKFKDWEKDFRQEYSNSFDDAKKRNSRDFLKNIRYMILDYIVPFVLEKNLYPIKFNEEYVKDENGNIVKARFYINRLIQKLETNQGKELLLPDGSFALSNLSKVLARKDPIELEKTGKYGFDMSRARVEEVGGTALGKTRGFTFPQLRSGSSGLTKVFNDLMRLNYQRHMGPLPSDENFADYADMRDDAGNPSLIYKKLDSKSRNLEDNLNLVNLKISIKNRIKNFIARNRTESNWSNLKLKGLYDIVDKKFSDEIEQGEWAVSSDKMVNYIINNLPSGYKIDGPKKEFVMRYVSNYQKVSGNSPISDKFAEYFSNKQVDYILSSRKGAIASPRILDGENYEQRKSNFERIEPKLKKQITDNLSPEEIDYFIKTGRLPLDLKDKKLIPGKFTHAPIILPFLKINSPNGGTITVPLIRPGKYLTGFQGIKDGGDVEFEPENEEPEEGTEEEKSSNISSLPSTSDRTSVYINTDVSGKEKEVKIIDASSTDRYVSKTGARGAYYATKKNEKGYGERKFGFSRWKKTDREAFLNVFSHPGYNQNFSLDDVITKYEQLFGKDVYEEIFSGLEDPESFYKKQELSDGFPFKLQGYRIAPEDERASKSFDDETSRSDGLNVASFANLTIKPDKDGDIIGFPFVIKAIVRCLTLKTRVCNNDGYLGYRTYYLEDADRVQDLHDQVVADAFRTNIWKNFTSKTSATNSFCSVIGKLFQGSRLGQSTRKKRLELIGSASNEYFKRLLGSYQNHLEDLDSKKKAPTTNKKKLSILNLINKINPLSDEDDDKVVEWFFPGYNSKSQMEKGKFVADPNNFSPSFTEWNKGQPPTDLKDLLSLIYDNLDSIPESYKNKIIDKIKKEKEYLVGNGDSSQGVLGTNSYIWNKNILNHKTDFGTIDDQVSSFHKYIKDLYNSDLVKLANMPESEISSDYEEEVPAKDSNDTTTKAAEQIDEGYIGTFRSYFSKLSPILIDVLTNSSKIPYIRSNLIENPRKADKTAEIISVLDIILNINKKSSVISLFNFLISNIEAPPPQLYKTTIYEKDYIKENRDAKSSSFLSVLYNISIGLYKLSDSFDDILNLLEKDVLDQDNRSVISVFIKQNFSEKESSKLFLVSNIYRNNQKALDHYNVSYFNFSSLIENIFQKVSAMNRPSVLRRIDSHNISSGEGFEIGKLSSWELVKLINSKSSDAEKSELSKKIKDYYLSKNKWDQAEPFLKKYVDSKIL